MVFFMNQLQTFSVMSINSWTRNNQRKGDYSSLYYSLLYSGRAGLTKLGRTHSMSVSEMSVGSECQVGSEPVTVKTLSLRQREVKRKVKIRYEGGYGIAYHPLLYYRYPCSRSVSRPRLRHKVDIRMEKQKLEE